MPHSNALLTALGASLIVAGCGAPAAAPAAPVETAPTTASVASALPIQPIVDAELARLAEEGVLRAAIVVLDPATGRVLAAGGHGPLGAAEAERVAGVGSTIKTLTVAAALDAGLDPSRRFDGEGGVWARADGPEVRDYHAHEYLDARGVLVHSSNIGAAKIVEALGAGPIREAFTRAGLSYGESDLAGVHGVPASPVTLARVYGAFGNGGERVDAETGERTRVVSEASAAAVLEMLEAAVQGEGTGQRAGGLEPAVGGKTGTTADGEALFAGFVPIERPRFVVVVRAQRAEQSYGGALAAPSFRRVAERVLPLLADDSAAQ